MPPQERFEQIVALVEERGFVSVKELGEILQVSEVTIRRDLQHLHDQQRLRRTFGGAFSVRLPAEAHAGAQAPAIEGEAEGRPGTQPAGAAKSATETESSPVDRVDVLIATSVDLSFDRALLDRATKRNVPVIAESVRIAGSRTLVSVDNYQAGMALGRWAGHYARQHFGGLARVLDLTYRLSNTQARSQGFVTGLREVLPAAEVLLSINAQSAAEAAYQLTGDVLDVHPDINIIFAINDATALGALRACQSRGANPNSLIVLPFGLEGDTLRNALVGDGHCKAGLAMFPEIVGPVCVEAAIDAYNDRPLPRHVLTPYAVLTAESLPQFYLCQSGAWQLNWENAAARLAIPLDTASRIAGADRASRRASGSLPRRIGIVVPFSEHEWYRNLTLNMQAHATGLGIGLEIIDAAQNMKADVALREREIAKIAADQVQPGDVILIDGGPVTLYLAEELAAREQITVITNSMPVFETLRDCPGITLIITGGVLSPLSDTLSGPTAELSFRELRADKLFLPATGITLGFGLSHTNLAEVATKQAMIRAAREVIVLADHTKFGQESVVQVAPLSVVTRLITDNALPANTRLDLTKMGIEVSVART